MTSVYLQKNAVAIRKIPAILSKESASPLTNSSLPTVTTAIAVAVAHTHQITTADAVNKSKEIQKTCISLILSLIYEVILNHSVNIFNIVPLPLNVNLCFNVLALNGKNALLNCIVTDVI
jgi:hypothetical protein